MKRLPEPELMDDHAQAEAYAAADFAEVNQSFVDRFLAQVPELAEDSVVDLGCGPGDIVIRLARARPGLRVTGIDGAENMLALARAASRDAGVADRTAWVHATLPGSHAGQFEAVISNSLLHHLHEPAVMWREVAALAAPGAHVLVMDLFRPDSVHDARAIVDTYAEGEPEVLRTDFYNSLLAAFTPDEVRDQLGAAGLDLHVETISDRHLVVSGTL